MNYKNHLGGKLAKSNGSFFEQQIDEACEWYKLTGLAYIEKTPEPMKPIASIGKGAFKAIFTKSAQPDYKGTLKGGQAICFEAKSTTVPHISQSRVTTEQMAALTLHQNLGAEVFILLCFTDCIIPDFYKIPFDVWKNMKVLYGRVHLKKEDLGQYKIKRDTYLKFL